MDSSFSSFELIGDHKVKCKTCGEEMPTGIITISNHWCNCTGKGFYNDLMEEAERKNGEVSLEFVEQLKIKHQ